MIEARKKVVGLCEALTGKAKDAAIEGNVAEKIAAIAGDAREKQLVVPVVGAFSSGKSTLINNLLGEDILPVAITPETSLATELHYSPENYILAVKDDGRTDRYGINEIKTVTEKARDYLYAQLYLNNENLRQIEPLVLVDMPGFNSPHDPHNDAITAYINRGCYYIVLSSVDNGTITKSLERRLHEIEGFKREFSLFVSKADKRPKEIVDKVVAYYQSQLEDRFGSTQKVESFGMSAEEVMKCLESIDAEAQFKNMYKEPLLDVCDDVITNINLQIKSAKNDGEKLRFAVDEMNRSKEKLRRKASSNIAAMSERYSGAFVNDIVDDVSRALNNSLDELTEIALSGNKGALEQSANEIVRSAYTTSVRGKLEGISKQITVDLSDSIGKLDGIMKNLKLDENYMQNLTDKVTHTLMTLGDLMSKGQPVADPDSEQSFEKTPLDIANNPMVSKGMQIGGAAVAGVGVATAASAAIPIIGIIVMVLPAIMNIFSAMMNSDPGGQRKKAEIRAKLAGEIFPEIKSKIRREASEKVQGQIEAMINSAREQLETQIANQEEAINAQIAQESTNAAEKEASQQKLETVRTEVQSIASEIMTWGK